MDCGRSLTEVREISVVLDHVVGDSSRLLGIDLRIHTRAHVRFIDTITLHHATDAVVLRCDDEHALFNEIDVPGFEKQRSNVNDELIGTRVAFLFQGKAPHEWMDDRVQALARCRISEHDLSEPHAIEHAVANDLRPRPCDRHQSIGVRGNGLARNRVGVDDERAEFFENASNLALAGPDTARQSYSHETAIIRHGTLREPLPKPTQEEDEREGIPRSSSIVVIGLRLNRVADRAEAHFFVER